MIKYLKWFLKFIYNFPECSGCFKNCLCTYAYIWKLCFNVLFLTLKCRDDFMMICTLKAFISQIRIACQYLTKLWIRQNLFSKLGMWSISVLFLFYNKKKKKYFVGHRIYDGTKTTHILKLQKRNTKTTYFIPTFFRRCNIFHFIFQIYLHKQMSVCI